MGQAMVLEGEYLQGRTLRTSMCFGHTAAAEATAPPQVPTERGTPHRHSLPLIGDISTAQQNAKKDSAQAGENLDLSLLIFFPLESLKSPYSPQALF